MRFRLGGKQKIALSVAPFPSNPLFNMSKQRIFAGAEFNGSLNQQIIKQQHTNTLIKNTSPPHTLFPKV